MAGFLSFAALVPTFIDLWSLSNTDAGWINGIFYAGYLCAVPVLVSLTDRVPPRKVYFFSMALSAASHLAFALFAEGFWTAMVFRTLAGIGLAGTYMPGLKLLTDYLYGTEHSRSLAFYTSSFGVGSSMSFVIAGEVSVAYGWAWTFGVAAAGPALAIVLVMALLPRKDPIPQESPDTHLLDFRPVLRCKPAMAYVLAYTAHNFELFAFRAWLVAFLAFAHAFDPAGGRYWGVTTLAAAINLIGVPASIFGNELAKRYGRHRLIMIAMVASSVLGCLIGLSVGWPFWMVVGFCLVYAVAIAGDSAALTAGVVGVAPEGYRGATMAVHSSIGFAGAFLGPLAVGVALDLAGGGQSAWSWWIAFAAVGLVVAHGPLAFQALSRRPRR